MTWLIVGAASLIGRMPWKGDSNGITVEKVEANPLKAMENHRATYSQLLDGLQLFRGLTIFKFPFYWNFIFPNFDPFLDGRARTNWSSLRYNRVLKSK